MLIISLKQLQRNNQHQAQQSWRKKKNSTEILKVFLCLRGPNFVKNLEFKKNLRTTQRKMRFESAFQVSKKFRTIQGVPGIQEALTTTWFKTRS